MDKQIVKGIKEIKQNGRYQTIKGTVIRLQAYGANSPISCYSCRDRLRYENVDHTACGTDRRGKQAGG